MSRSGSWTIAHGLLVIAAALVIAVYLVDLGAPLTQYDEPIHAQFITAMQRSGHLHILDYYGVHTVQRPPTANAIYALVAWVIPGEFGLRLAPALCTLLAAFLAGWIVKRYFRGGLAPAVLTALVLAGTPSVFLYGRLVLSDPPLVAALLGALAAILAAQESPRYLVHAAVCLGLAVAIKSLAAMIPIMAVTPALWATIRRHRRHPELRPIRALIVFLALATPYYIIGFISYGQQFWNEHIVETLLERARGDIEVSTIGGPAAYLLHVWRADGALHALALLGGVLGAGILAALWRDRLLAITASSAVLCLLLLSLVGTRLAHYLLVFYPLAGICLGGVVARLTAYNQASQRLLTGLIVTCAAALFISGVAREPFDAGAEPSAVARDLGRLAAGYDGPLDSSAIHTIDWYAPSLGWYAQRPWRFLTSSPQVARRVQASEVLRRSGAVMVVPPWPSGRFLLAGPRYFITSHPHLQVIEILAEDGSESHVLAVVSAGVR